MEFHDRLKEARRARFATAKAAASYMDVPQPTYAHHEAGTRKPKSEEIVRYAKAFRVSPEWLLFGAGGAKLPIAQPAIDTLEVNFVAVRGKAQAGIWMEFDEFEGQGLDPVPTVPGAWRSYEQFAYQVKGPSMNLRGIDDGCFVICVRYSNATGTRRDPDIVVVERRRGGVVERTVKELITTKTETQLWPRSSDARFQSPIVVKKDKPDNQDDGTEIEVVGLVIGVWRPMGR
jgi:SOS-response transcriptional repressor LexA